MVEKKTVLSIMNNKSTTEVEKKNIILSDLSRESFELSKKIMYIFSEYETKIFFYSEKNDYFLDGEKIVANIEELLTNASLVFNFVSVKKQKSRDLSRYIEKLKISSIQNTLSTRMIFSAKNNVKKIFESFDLKTPQFDFIGEKTVEESFANNIQPSRIFLASDNFFSEKLESPQDIQKVFDKLGNKISKYFMEEWIDGRNIYSFVFLKDGQVYAYTLEKVGSNMVSIDSELSHHVSEYVKKVFLKLGIGKFALINIKKTKNRGFFILNILTDWDILMGNHGEILNKIFEKESVTEKSMLNSFL